MERQDLVEQVLRLYVWVMDQKEKANQQTFGTLSAELKKEWKIARDCFDDVKDYIETHFRPLV